MNNRKDFLIQELEAYRFRPIDVTLFQHYNEYEELCKQSQDDTGLLTLEFYKGETAYRQGHYQEAEHLLNTCLLHDESEAPDMIWARCHNLLGLIYSAMGFQIFSLEHYLEGLDYAVRGGSYRQKTVIQLNIGWFYRDLGDYDKSLFYYYQSVKDLALQDKEDYYNLEVLCYSYIGQIYFKTKNYTEGLDLFYLIKQLVLRNSTIFYDTSVRNLFVRTYHHLGDTYNLEKTIEELIKSASNSDDFLEFSESYLDVCDFILDFDKVYSRKLLDALHVNVKKTSLVFLKLKFQTLEVKYHAKYSQRQDYLEACSQYMIMQQNYDTISHKCLLNSINNIEVLRKVQKERQLYFEQSRHDLMTGLLNKISFEQLVEGLLQLRNEKDPSACAFAIIDLDHFKEINDSLGHTHGDKVIRYTVSCMSKVFGDSTILGRIGGDEFGVFWSKPVSREAIDLQARCMQELFSKSCLPADENLYTTVSIGIMYEDRAVLSYEALFNRADKQLYNAKAQGRNTISLEDNWL